MDWDDRLISRQRAYDLAGEWPLEYSTYHLASGQELHLICARCGLSAGRLNLAGRTPLVTMDGMISMVLRHMVMQHAVALNNGGKEANGRDEAPAADAGNGPANHLRGQRIIDRRPHDQEPVNQ